MDEDREWKAALASAVRFLARRARSRLEVEQRLQRAGFSSPVIDRVTTRLEERGYLDDETFGRQWARARLARMPMGAHRLYQELLRRGVAKELAKAIAGEVAGEEREREMALEAARKKMRTLGSESPERMQARLFRFLVGRGFSYELARRVVEEVT